MSARRVVLLAALVALAAVLVTWQLAARFMPGLLPEALREHQDLSSPIHLGEGLRQLEDVAWLDGHRPDDPHWRHAPFVVCAFSDTDPRSETILSIMQAWSIQYAGKFTFVVVHSPEYAFAADTQVTGRFVRRLGLTLAVALDPDASIARSLGGIDHGPVTFMNDGNGHTMGGSASIGQIEVVARELGTGVGPDAHPNPIHVDLGIPRLLREIRLGAGRVPSGPLRGLPVGHEQVFSAEFQYQEHGEPDVPYPIGGWRMGADGVTATRGGAAEVLSIKYSAGRAGVVLSPPADGPVRVWVLHDERWPVASDQDEDIQTDSRGAAFVLVREPRLYWIDRGSRERVLKLSPDREGLTVHAFVATDAHRE